MKELTPKDIERGRHILKNEVTGTDYNTVFQSIVYTILAQREQFQHQVDCFNKMMANELIASPRRCLSRPSEVWEMLRHMSLNKTKFCYILCAAQNYSRKMHNTMVSGINLPREDQIEIRKKIVNTVDGLSFKGASLVMVKCGYPNIVPIDTWIYKWYDHKGNNSITWNNKYVELENMILNDAKLLNLTGAEYQASIWGKSSTYRGTEIVDYFKSKQKLITNFKGK